MVELALAIQILPLLAFIVILFAGRKSPDKMPFVAIGAIATSFVLSVIVFTRVQGGEMIDKSYDWFISGSQQLSVGVLIDPLAAVMLLVVTSVATLVMIFSYGYMHGEERVNWYFSAISLFSTAMLALILSNNFLQLLISWEIVGVCSYFLIGFYYKTDDAAYASKKAFIVTKIGDVGMIVGIILIFITFGTLHFGSVFNEAHIASKSLITVIALLLFCGAIGKSAQFPLHVWLPDAMAGPTPVSALIHAATMVAAGVYLVGRSMPLFEVSGSALTFVAYIGAITAILAATIATAVVDIKKILAYSTISQLGYMMIGLGVGSLSAGMFHLFTHAFFKALLFLGAGSIIHALHTQDIREMGGLISKMKVTVVTFILGSLALAGIPPLSGFWSKDEILTEALHHEYYLIFGVGLVVAFLTAFYMSRLCFLAFFGKPHEIHDHHDEHGWHDEHKVHESPAVMTVPLGILAIGAVFAGFWGSPLTHHAFTFFLHPESGEIKPDYMVMAGSIIVAVSGIFAGYMIYVKKVISPANLAVFKPVTNILINKYWFDEIYHFIFVKPCIGLSRAFAWFDLKVVDGIVNGVGWLSVGISRLGLEADLHIVDGIVNVVGAFFVGIGAKLRNIQAGQVQLYGIYMFAAIIVLFFFIMRGGL